MTAMCQEYNIDDDEALARLLQLEEHVAKKTVVSSSLYSRSFDQERRDFELARQFARKDMESFSRPRANHGQAYSPLSSAMQDAAVLRCNDRSAFNQTTMRESQNDIPRGLEDLRRGQLALLKHTSTSKPTQQISYRTSTLRDTPTTIDESGQQFRQDGTSRNVANLYACSPDVLCSQSRSNLSGRKCSSAPTSSNELKNIQHLPKRHSFDCSQTSGPVQKMTASGIENDWYLASRMQELEESGMGKMNSQRRVLDVLVTSEKAQLPDHDLSGASPRFEHSKTRSTKTKAPFSLLSKQGNDLLSESLKLPVSSSKPGESVTSNKRMQDMLTTTSLNGSSRATASKGLNPSSSSTNAMRSEVTVRSGQSDALYTHLPSSSSSNINTHAPRHSFARPPGNIAPDSNDYLTSDAILDVPIPAKKEKRIKSFMGLRAIRKDISGHSLAHASPSSSPKDSPPNSYTAGLPSVDDMRKAIPATMPKLPVSSTNTKAMVLGAKSLQGGVPQGQGQPPKDMTSSISTQNALSHTGALGRHACYNCGQSHGSFVKALGRKYHRECLKCATCKTAIDVSIPFAYSKEKSGSTSLHHSACYAEKHGTKCVVCKTVLSATSGSVSYANHPFFDDEKMCLSHAENPGRRCTSCHRFEPVDEPFADLHDGNRCICYACCRTVILDSKEVEPIWSQVMLFFEHYLNVPVWKTLRDVPVLAVNAESISRHYKGNQEAKISLSSGRGLCITDAHINEQDLQSTSLIFDTSTGNVSIPHERGNESDRSSRSKRKKKKVFAILCLSGLPRDLVGSVLAHEATHAWFNLHPDLESSPPLPHHVEEGIAQLVSMLFLTDALESLPHSAPDETVPTGKQLRNYFRYCIENDSSKSIRHSYRKAAFAFNEIGIEALVGYVLKYRDFPAPQIWLTTSTN
jgi:hypothetical protein